ncbi:peroxiredoxin [Corallococcus sp. AB011P]|uniref:peroxiredoxin n=1 Tax=unclassified Corallococcus TaxID=2685029 RepID=UPI000EA35993|nr:MULTISPECIES: peroxiredoxin [unclassified Corallococcus]RKG59962.1 peroxiredoxin [Corallococcus sp. AB011P]RKH90719.1 peroxiredoxin [Corallococcus sp. AB045]
MAKMLKEGDAVPDVTLQGPGGAPVRLRDLMGDKAMVIYFYPRDDSPGCTVQACSLRDQYQDFSDAGADVVGISSDSAESHEKFVAKYRLPFRLLSDPDGAARKAFGVGTNFLGLLPGRVTFVADKGGTIRYAFDSQIQVKKHAEHALDVVRSLTGQGAAPTRSA